MSLVALPRLEHHVHIIAPYAMNSLNHPRGNFVAENRTTGGGGSPEDAAVANFVTAAGPPAPCHYDGSSTHHVILGCEQERREITDFCIKNRTYPATVYRPDGERPVPKRPVIIYNSKVISGSDSGLDSATFSDRQEGGGDDDDVEADIFPIPKSATISYPCSSVARRTGDPPRIVCCNGVRISPNRREDFHRRQNFYSQPQQQCATESGAIANNVSSDDHLQNDTADDAALEFMSSTSCTHVKRHAHQHVSCVTTHERVTERPVTRDACGELVSQSDKDDPCGDSAVATDSQRSISLPGPPIAPNVFIDEFKPFIQAPPVRNAREAAEIERDRRRAVTRGENLKKTTSILSRGTVAASPSCCTMLSSSLPSDSNCSVINNVVHHQQRHSVNCTSCASAPNTGVVVGGAKNRSSTSPVVRTPVKSPLMNLAHSVKNNVKIKLKTSS